jgi:hypothetical protein
MAGNFRPPNILMSPFQKAQMGRPVTGWSGIIPMQPRFTQATAVPINKVKR